ncbi:unnamed protein product [Closterium sp. Yama58-4]|nr:unnamed protein product [Closterium sp. Yama58-4]
MTQNLSVKTLQIRHRYVPLETQPHLSSVHISCARPSTVSARYQFPASSVPRAQNRTPSRKVTSNLTQSSSSSVYRAQNSVHAVTTADAATAIAMSLPRRPLGRTGLNLSIVSFGASPLGSVFEEIDEEEGVRAVHEAVNLGINLFDVSPFYGSTRAETVLGRAIATLPCPREDVVIATKVGRYGQDEFDFSAGRIKRSVEESCARLQTPYVDIVQCHDIEFGSLDQIVNETIPALQELKAAGKIRFIGITGLPLSVYRSVLPRLLPGSLDLILSYCHYSLNDTTLEPLLPWLQQQGVGVISASPFSMGLLTPQGPPSWHPAPQPLKDACKAAALACEQRGASLPRLALQFATINPAITTTLVGMCTVQQVRENVAAAIEAAERGIDEAMLKEVEGILAPYKDTTWASGRPENN